MISDRQMRRSLMIELFSTTGLLVSSMAENLWQLASGMAAAVIYAAWFLWIGKRYEIEKIGNIRKTIYSVRFFLYACFLGSLMKVLVSDLLLKGGNGWYVFFPAFLLAIYANRGGRRERAGLMELLFWFIFLPLFFVVILALKDVHLSCLVEGNLQPSRSIQTFLCFTSLEILLFFHGKTTEKIKALGFVFLLNIVVFAAVIGMYGSGITQNTKFPVISVIRMVRLPGGFLERLDLFILSFWILSLFAIFSAYCFYGTRFWKKKSETGSRKSLWIRVLFYTGVWIVVIWNSFEWDRLLVLFQTYLLWIDVPLAIILPLLEKPQMKRAVAVTMISTLILIMTGCGIQRINIEDRAYVLAVGIEQKDENWQIGFFLPDNRFVEITGKDWENIKNQFQTCNEKELEMGHLKAMVIKTGTDIREFEIEQNESDFPNTALLFQTAVSMERLQEESKKKESDLGTILTELAKRNRKKRTLGDYLASEKELPEISIRTDLLTVE